VVLFEEITGASLLKHGAPYRRLSVETWIISRKWSRRPDVARAPAENKHVARHAASLLVPQKHGLRGDGPSPDINHEVSLGTKPSDEVAEDAGEHVSRDAASLLVPQEDGLRGDGPSPDTSNHKASLSPKPPDEVAEDAGEHVSRDAASLLVPQEDGLRGDGPPSTTFTTRADVPSPTRVDDARESLSVAFDAIGLRSRRVRVGTTGRGVPRRGVPEAQQP
jgi:hypothetical protein